MAVCPVDSFITATRFPDGHSWYTCGAQTLRMLLWQASDSLFPKHSPHIRQGHGLLENYVSHCPSQCQRRATWSLTGSSGRCYHDIRKSPQLKCPSTSRPLASSLPLSPTHKTCSHFCSTRNENRGFEVKFRGQVLQPQRALMGYYAGFQSCLCTEAWRPHPCDHAAPPIVCVQPEAFQAVWVS